MLPFHGIPNLGATCYMNSTIQAFINSPPIRAMLNTKNEQASNYYDQIISSIKQLIFRQQFQLNKILDPQQICASLGIIGDKIYEQEDANLVQKQLCEAFEQVYGEDKVFTGFEKQVIFCRSCGMEKSKMEKFSDVQIGIEEEMGRSVYQAYQAEQLQYSCDCGSTDVQMQHLYQKFPEQLIFTYQRFKFDAETFQFVKNEKSVQILPKIDVFGLKFYKDQSEEFVKVLLSPWEYYKSCSLSCQNEISQIQELQNYLLDNYVNKTSQPEFLYHLHSVVCHTGQASYGHYYSYINMSKTDIPQFYLFNDSLIEKQSNLPKDANDKAYMCYYVKHNLFQELNYDNFSTEEIKSEIANQNEKDILSIYKIDLEILTNHSSNNEFSLLTSQKPKFVFSLPSFDTNLTISDFLKTLQLPITPDMHLYQSFNTSDLIQQQIKRYSLFASNANFDTKLCEFVKDFKFPKKTQKVRIFIEYGEFGRFSFEKCYISLILQGEKGEDLRILSVGEVVGSICEVSRGEFVEWVKGIYQPEDLVSYEIYQNNVLNMEEKMVFYKGDVVRIKKIPRTYRIFVKNVFISRFYSYRYENIEEQVNQYLKENFPAGFMSKFGENRIVLNYERVQYKMVLFPLQSRLEVDFDGIQNVEELFDTKIMQLFAPNGVIATSLNVENIQKKECKLDYEQLYIIIPRGLVALRYFKYHIKDSSKFISIQLFRNGEQQTTIVGIYNQNINEQEYVKYIEKVTEEKVIDLKIVNNIIQVLIK